MVAHAFRRIPKHLGVIPDGNRRWAEKNGLSKEKGYAYGLQPGMMLYEVCVELGVEELTFYGFTQDNTKRPSLQTAAFRKACVEAVKMLSARDACLLVVGDASSPLFPKELIPYTMRRTFGRGGIKINFLVNYGWKWDLGNLQKQTNNGSPSNSNFLSSIASAELFRIDLIIRWGGRRRLSGFLPVQTIYADFYVVDDMWPDFRKEHVYDGLLWYQNQDVTLGG